MLDFKVIDIKHHNISKKIVLRVKYGLKEVKMIKNVIIGLFNSLTSDNRTYGMYMKWKLNQEGNTLKFQDLELKKILNS